MHIFMYVNAYIKTYPILKGYKKKTTCTVYKKLVILIKSFVLMNLKNHIRYIIGNTLLVIWGNFA